MPNQLNLKKKYANKIKNFTKGLSYFCNKHRAENKQRENLSLYH